MLTIYNAGEFGLTTVTEPIEGCWLNVIEPTLGEIAQLQSMGIPQDFITSPLDLDERARTERENSEILIVVRIPLHQGEKEDIPYITVPLGIILTDGYVITVCKQNNEILQKFATGDIRNLSTSKRNRFVLRMLLAIANKYLIYLRDINRAVDILEDRLQLSTRNKEVLELLKYEKSLTYFTTGLKSNELMMERLQRSQLFRTFPDDEDLLEDVLTETQQAIEMTSITSNILSSMMDAFASIISNNLNAVMKFLASITVVLSLPTIISSLFGMNVSVPLQGHSQAFLIVIAFTFMVSLMVVFIFWKKDWF